jgi:glycosyltransferase involved in cell wall biosynthesis
MAVATVAAAPAHELDPYLLYCGRIDTHKGCAQLIAGFESYKRAHPSRLRLLLTGSDQLGVRETDDVRYLGFVDEARKLSLMAGAVAFVHPSPYESLSIVALEAMAQGTPLVVNGECEILADHVEVSGSGFIFRGEAQLHDALDRVLALGADARAAQGALARAYVVDHYSRPAVRARLVAEIDALAARD